MKSIVFDLLIGIAAFVGGVYMLSRLRKKDSSSYWVNAMYRDSLKIGLGLTLLGIFIICCLIFKGKVGLFN